MEDTFHLAFKPPLR